DWEAQPAPAPSPARAAAAAPPPPGGMPQHPRNLEGAQVRPSAPATGLAERASPAPGMVPDGLAARIDAMPAAAGGADVDLRARIDRTLGIPEAPVRNAPTGVGTVGTVAAPLRTAPEGIPSTSVSPATLLAAPSAMALPAPSTAAHALVPHAAAAQPATAPAAADGMATQPPVPPAWPHPAPVAASQPMGSAAGLAFSTAAGTPPSHAVDAPAPALGSLSPASGAAQAAGLAVPQEPALDPVVERLRMGLQAAGFDVLARPPVQGHVVHLAAERPDSYPHRVICRSEPRLTMDVALDMLDAARDLGADVALVVAPEADPEAQRRLIATKAKHVTPERLGTLSL
ncbi:MAG TPA: hypothetical protein VFH47_03010, partial [Candidatus Thermoplasmatota archaeon]|nr:hypothetical protein [Candidatus Thermoplasmatota archaeon]